MTPETAPETLPDTVSGSEPRFLTVFSSFSAPRQNLGSPPVRRLPRSTRAKQSWRPALVLQERDIAFLRAAADYRLLSTPQYLLLFPESRDAVYRRLQLLFHHGYLDRLNGDPTKPIVYALGNRGAEVLVECGQPMDIRGWRKKNQELRDRYVAHQAMINNFRIALTLAIKKRPDVRLLFFKPEGLALRDRVTLVANGKHQTFPINPDGFFGLQFPSLPEGRNRAFFFLEADRSTMTRERFIEKLLGYREWYSQGGHTKKHGIRTFRILTVTKSEERMTNLLQAASETQELLTGLPLFWFTSEKRFTPNGPSSIFNPIWECPAQPGKPQSILPSEAIVEHVPTDAVSRRAACTASSSATPPAISSGLPT